MPGRAQRLPRSWTALVLVSIVGCYQSAPPPPTWRSGSRLRARIERLDDGTTRRVGWFDRELGIDCQFARAADGVHRCIPAAEDAGELVYLDAACTEPALELPAACEVPAIVQHWRPEVLANATTCDIGEGPEMLRLDSSRRAHAYHRLVDGVCGSEIATSGGVIPILGTVPLDRLASATVERRPLTARLDVEVLVASDGAMQRLDTFHDRDRDQRCQIGSWIATLGRAPCAPSPLAHAEPGYSLDASCASPTMLAVIVRGCGPLGSAYVGGTCTTMPELREAGPAVVGPIYEDGIASCLPYENPFSELYEVGAPLDPGGLVTAVAGTRGSGRVRVRTAEVDGVLASDQSWVTDAGEDCHAVAFSDGTTRCAHGLEYHDLEARTFTDPACSEPIFRPYGPCGGPRELALHLAHVDGECGNRCDAVQLLEELPPGPRYARDPSGACVETEGGLGRDMRIAGELPFDTFAPIALETE